ncbi:glyoxylase-like metal-dependent hydrolase (beta-lactamase superfamily II) [Evansella vedderi]|uniref:Glyoxylase-like metal-dependent hydrolase (Beta-lactamase superfamily II) n=1 Tax=Evansella vedderi TaxID=38282 RepID=A0ABT9ZSD2_9BACI|nr:MBL fold metallo-hydrolase [Evansella vedderi]MDQ0253388.1 glyoxylase-like metal-dependent hydrolase (beta-lactamase superfamily II) [Evansella vedderi]
MENNKPIDLGKGISLIDGFDLGLSYRTGTYVIHEEELTLIETGPSPSVPYILQGLKELGYNPEDVRYIIVTHIHLDHAGGAGLLLQSCKNAKVVVHPRGFKHLANPSRLIAGARAVYGSEFDSLFDPIIPIPEEQLIVKNDGDQLKIGEKCKLQFLDTPGHASHHFSIYDPVRNGIFTGDTVGMQYEWLKELKINFHLPITSPNQFNPDTMLQSIERVRSINVDSIYYGHFSMTNHVNDALNQVVYWIEKFVKEGERLFKENDSQTVLASRLYELVQDYLLKRNVPEDHRIYPLLKQDMEICAMGILDYLNKHEKELTIY